MKTIKDYLAEGNTYESLQGKAILCHGEIQYISNNFFTKEEIADYYEGLEDRVCSEEAKYKMRLYGGSSPESKWVNWIYTNTDFIAPESLIPEEKYCDEWCRNCEKVVKIPQSIKNICPKCNESIPVRCVRTVKE